jgi:hypothetical protein
MHVESRGAKRGEQVKREEQTSVELELESKAPVAAEQSGSSVSHSHLVFV